MTAAKATGVLVSILLGTAGATLRPPSAEASEVEGADEAREGQRDFDFLVGSWTMKNRRLGKPLSGSSTWQEFGGMLVARKVGDGRAVLDEVVVDLPSGRVHGVTLSLYDPQARQWSQHWSNLASGTLDAPLVGSFRNGRGELYQLTSHEGRAIYARNVWCDITPTSVRWEQAFSTDGGRTWETNWTAELTRVR